jgi:hypothetical protein
MTNRNRPWSKRKNKICSRCHKEFTPASNHQKYCTNCSLEVVKETSVRCSKKWTSAYRKDPDRVRSTVTLKPKTCIRCGHTFVPTGGAQEYCVGCRPGIKRELEIKWNAAHPDYYKEWYVSHPGYEKERSPSRAPKMKVYRIAHHDEIRAREKEWIEQNPDLYTAKIHRQNAKRRKLGFIPLNKPFPGCEGHHIDKEHVVHIPKELHRSIPHNVWSGRNMNQINVLVYLWTR